MSHGDLEDVALLDRLAATLGLPSHCGSPPEVSLLGEEVNTQHCTRSVSLAASYPSDDDILHGPFPVAI